MMMFKLLRGVARPKDCLVVVKSIDGHEFRKVFAVLRIDEIISGKCWATV